MRSAITEISEMVKTHPESLMAAQVVLALFHFSRNSHGGRYTLASEICAKESKARLIIQEFQKKGFLKVKRGRTGAEITEGGRQLGEALQQMLCLLNYDKSMDMGILTLGEDNALVAVPFSCLNPRTSVIDIRDAAIACGASGATAFIAKVSKTGLNLSFYQANSPRSSFDQSIVNALSELEMKLQNRFTSVDADRQILIIAGSVKRPAGTSQNNGSRALNTCDPFRTARIAALNAGWTILTHP